MRTLRRYAALTLRRLADWLYPEPTLWVGKLHVATLPVDPDRRICILHLPGKPFIMDL